ncbi:MAG TPA: uracil-DNA glycosylase [Pseudobdellovibrionaceae bacterium]|nr:uracil-DNA glycosylase [Pseudobdellovibrionaceae bacterium]
MRQFSNLHQSDTQLQKNLGLPSRLDSEGAQRKSNQAEVLDQSRTRSSVGESQASQFPDDWKALVADQFAMPYMQSLRDFLRKRYQEGARVYPPKSEYFQAFRLTNLQNLKVVILGQDPYHGPGQAHGLCFSVPAGMKHPPSLQNILKELNADLGLPYPKSGSLVPWARQGVLLLNAVLTVEEGQAGAHANKGWEQFTDAVIHSISKNCQNVAFVLWGNYAAKKASLIDSRHHIIRCVHPSPLSAHRGFMGSKPFSQINSALKQFGQEPIDWRLE